MLITSLQNKVEQPTLKAISFFDFDGTITTKDTLAEILKFIKGKRSYYLGLFALSPILVAFKLKLIPNQKAKEMLLSYFLRGMDETVFNNLCHEFVTTRLPAIIRKPALDEIKRSLKEGHTVVVVSASPENWVLPWCRQYNIACITTKLEIKEGRLTGQINGKNCRGQEKVRKILSQYHLADYATTTAYGDTKDDLPMLDLMNKAFYKPFRQ